MEVNWTVFLIIIGAAMVTFIPRVLPLVVLNRIRIPDWGMRWLNYVPIAVMASLVGQELFMNNGELSPLRSNIELLAALPTFLTAVISRSLLGTVVIGIISIMVLRYIF